MAIRSFTHKGLERLYLDDDPRGVPPALAAKVKRVLFALAQAQAISDMALFPGWRLHPLKGHLAGYWSISITGNRRIIFRFEDGDALDVELIDYH